MTVLVYTCSINIGVAGSERDLAVANYVLSMGAVCLDSYC